MMQLRLKKKMKALTVNKSYVYKNGLPFDSVLADNLDMLIDRVRINKAVAIIITGGVGEGKTTLAVHCADYINSKYGLPVIKLEPDDYPQLSIGGREFVQKMKKCFLSNLPIVIYDEGGDYSRKSAMTTFNLMLNRVFETYRALRIVVIICLPSLYVLDKSLYDNKIPRLALHCYNRNMKHGMFKGYSLHRMYYLLDDMKKFSDKGFAYKKNEPNFYGRFLDLPPERSKMLDAITVKGKLDILDMAGARMEGLVNYRTISSKVGKSVIWIKIVMKKLGIKPSKKFGREVFFEEEVIDKILQFQEEGGVVTKGDEDD